jgi:hypothetical protein
MHHSHPILKHCVKCGADLTPPPAAPPAPPVVASVATKKKGS